MRRQANAYDDAHRADTWDQPVHETRSILRVYRGERPEKTQSTDKKQAQAAQDSEAARHAA